MTIKQAAAKLGISEEAFDAASHDTARWDRSEWRRLRFANPAVVAALQSVRAREELGAGLVSRIQYPPAF